MGKASYLGVTRRDPRGAENHRLDAADRRRGPDSRPFPGGKGAAAPRIRDLGWDAGCRRSGDPGCEPRDRRRKFACLSLSFSLGVRGKFKELPHSGAGDSEPRSSPSFPAILPFRREAWEKRRGKAAAPAPAPLIPRCRARAQPAEAPAEARGARRSRRPLSASSFPPAQHLARPCAPTVRAARSLRTGGAPEPQPPRLRPSLPGASS